MNITVLSAGARMSNWVNKATGKYSKRFRREINYALKEIRPEKHGPGVSVEQGTATEEKQILEAIPQGVYLVALDERDKAPTLLELADYLKIWMQSGGHICFIIGGTDGMTEELKQ